MAIKTYDDTNFTMIASAIRAKNGSETQYKPREMAPAINALKMARDVEPNNSTSGLKVYFEDGAEGEKYNSLILNIPPLQDGSGDPTPTNKRAFKEYARFVVNYSGADKTDYETYTLNNRTLGGSIDLISGVQKYHNNSMMLVNYSNRLTTYTEGGVTIFYLPNSSSFGDIYSESLKTVERYSSLSEAAQNMPNNSIAGSKGEAQGTIGFFIRADSFSTVSELIAALGTDKNYPTAWMEETTISSGLFTGVTELGVNNLWATGYQMYDEYLSQDIPLEVSYKADPTLYTQGQVYEAIKNLLPQDTASGAVANFPDGSDGYPIVEGIFNIEPYQEGSGDPSPSNVRPISGFTGMDINKTGKNFVDNSKLVITGGPPYVNMTFEKAVFLPIGLYKVSISNVKNATSWRFGFRFFESNGTIIERAITNGYVRFSPALIETYNNNTACLQNTNGTTTEVTLTILKACFLSCCFSNGDISETTTVDYQIEVGSTATAYEPYQGSTISIDWTDSAGTVYGGKLNLTTGELTATHALIDLSTLTFDYNSSYKRFSAYGFTPLIKQPPNNNSIVNAYCSLFVVSTSNNTASNNFDNIIGVSSGGTLQIRATSVDGDTTALATLLEGSQFIYEVAEPITYQLTPQEIKTLLGTNNIWCNTGDSEIKYRADIALYIDKISNS